MALLIEAYAKEQDAVGGSGPCGYNEIEAKVIIIGPTAARGCTAPEEE